MIKYVYNYYSLQNYFINELVKHVTMKMSHVLLAPVLPFTLQAEDRRFNVVQQPLSREPEVVSVYET